MMDLKTIAIGILIGLLIVSGVGYGVVLPQMSSLQNQINILQSQVTSYKNEADKVPELQHQISTMKDNKTLLQSQITSLQDQINTIQQQITQRNEQIQILSSQVNFSQPIIQNLTKQMEEKDQNYTTLKNDYNTLQLDYDELLQDYNALTKPVSKTTTLDDLNIVFTVDKSVYSYTDSVTGTMKITYKDGSSFIGTFQIDVQGNHWGLDSSAFHINGFTSWMLSSPIFQTGPGDYKFAPFAIWDNKGYYIYPNVLTSCQVTVLAK